MKRQWTEEKSYMVKVVRVTECGPAEKIDCAEEAANYWRTTIEKQPWFESSKEHLVVLLLNTKYRIQAWNLISIGSLQEAIAHPRETFRAAIVSSAAAVILLHNHPSGHANPSRADIMLTQRMKKVAELVQITFLDHVIIGAGECYFSFTEARAARKLDPGPKRARARLDSKIAVARKLLAYVRLLTKERPQHLAAVELWQRRLANENTRLKEARARLSLLSSPIRTAAKT